MSGNIRKNVFLFSVIVVVLVLGGCIGEKKSPGKESEKIVPADSPGVPERGFFMGVLPTTAEGQTLEEAYSQAAEYAEFVPVWGRPTPFYNLAEDLGGGWGDIFVERLIRGNGMFPVVHMSFIGEGMTLITPPGMENATLSDPRWRAAYKEAALSILRASRPLYLSLGNEVNRWYETYGVDGPSGFAHYVSLYEEIYDEVKAISPTTRVFCVFAREITAENREADLHVLDLFNMDKLDILVFTSYPYAVRGINDPSDIPDDYYSGAASPDKPFGFSELGWPSLEAFGGERGQAEFLTRAAGRLTVERGVKLHLLGWAWLCDLDENDAIGLIRKNGTEKQAYGVWKELSGGGPQK